MVWFARRPAQPANREDFLLRYREFQRDRPFSRWWSETKKLDRSPGMSGDSAEGLAKLRFGPFKDLLLSRRKIRARAIEIKIQHGHCGLIGSALSTRELRSAECLSERAIRWASEEENIFDSRSRALLFLVTSPDQRRGVLVLGEYFARCLAFWDMGSLTGYLSQARGLNIPAASFENIGPRVRVSQPRRGWKRCRDCGAGRSAHFACANRA